MSSLISMRMSILPLNSTLMKILKQFITGSMKVDRKINGAYNADSKRSLEAKINKIGIKKSMQV